MNIMHLCWKFLLYIAFKCYYHY